MTKKEEDVKRKAQVNWAKIGGVKNVLSTYERKVPKKNVKIFSLD